MAPQATPTQTKHTADRCVALKDNMKAIYSFLFIVCFFFACNETAIRNAIPNNQLINELIIETIKQNSLDTSLPMNDKLINYYLVETKIIPGDKAPPPPLFRNEKGEPFKFEAFSSRQKYWIGINLSPEDSVAILKQIIRTDIICLDTNKLKSIIKVVDFSKWSNEKYRETKSYIFLMPIFNHNKTIAWVEYDYHSPGCGYGTMVVFKKLNNSWVKFAEYNTWKN